MRNERVSIPHRYCKNGLQWIQKAGLEGVSIPHRYCKNFRLPCYQSIPSAVSIPHRYCKNGNENRKNNKS